jgi:NAD(P)H-nitrite reductase large subunit
MSCCSPNRDDDDNICICFHVPRRKVIKYVRRERPRVVSLISECLSAGTGCGWCIPFLERIHEDVMAGRDPGPGMTSQEYLRRRAEYRAKLAAGDPDPRV